MFWMYDFEKCVYHPTCEMQYNLTDKKADQSLLLLNLTCYSLILFVATYTARPFSDCKEWRITETSIQIKYPVSLHFRRVQCIIIFEVKSRVICDKK